MSDVATFEFQTDVNLTSIHQEVAKHWTGKGRSIDVYTWEDPTRTFCILEYFYSEPEERKMLHKVAVCLLEIARDKCIYYYRCIDFVGFLDPRNYFNPEEVANYQPVEINTTDLLLDLYQPSMCADIVKKFVIRGNINKSCKQEIFMS
jgi:hypothetical protein